MRGGGSVENEMEEEEDERGDDVGSGGNELSVLIFSFIRLFSLISLIINEIQNHFLFAGKDFLFTDVASAIGRKATLAST